MFVVASITEGQLDLRPTWKGLDAPPAPPPPAGCAQLLCQGRGTAVVSSGSV